MGTSAWQDVAPAEGSEEMIQSSPDAEDYGARVACRTATEKLFQEKEEGGLNTKNGEGAGGSAKTNGTNPGAGESNKCH